MMNFPAKALCATAILIALTQMTSAQTPAPSGDTAGGTAAKGSVVGPGNTPQAGIPVQIVGPPGQTVAITDKDGTWSVYNLPAGDYKVMPVGTETPNNAKQVTFSVKEKSFWSKFVGSASETVKSPQIKLEANMR